LVGYRRYRQNEMDEPRTTQPELYSLIDQHPIVTAILAEQLQEENIITEDAVTQITDEVFAKLQSEYDGMKEEALSGISELNMPEYLAKSIEHYENADDLEIL